MVHGNSSSGGGSSGDVVIQGNSSSGGGSTEGSEHARRLLVSVVGSGNASALGVPRELAGEVRLYERLGFFEFYDTICRWVRGAAREPEGSG